MDRLSAVPEAATAAVRLRAALKRWNGDGPPERPLVVTLVGGTGVGKSRLFSALIEQPDASPSSHGRRCFTRRPYVALRRSDRPFVTCLDRFDPVYCHHANPDWERIVLVDTPDVDGVHTGERELVHNWELTRRVVDLSDVVVYVTSPEKYSNERTLQELAAWAERKRFLFVYNKADQVERGESNGSPREEMDRRLAELGFAVGNDRRFMVSAELPDRFDLQKLRRTIFRTPTPEQTQAVREANALGHVRYALKSELIGPIEKKAAALGRGEQELDEEVRQLYLDSLNAEPIAETTRGLVRDRTWVALAGRVGGPIALPVYLRSRLSSLSSMYLVSRIAMRGAGAFGLFASAASAAVAVVRGRLSLHRVLDLMGPAFQQKLARLKTRVRREVEDEGLASLLPLEEPLEPPVNAESNGKAPWWLPFSTKQLTSALDGMIQKTSADRELVTHLETDIERMVQKSVQAVVRRPWVWLANALPLAALGHILWRLGDAWVAADYLPGAFYAMALGVFLGSCLPGYWLLSRRVHAEVEAPDFASLVAGIERPLVTAPIRRVREELDSLVSRARTLDRNAAHMQQVLSDELHGVGFDPPRRQRVLESV